MSLWKKFKHFWHDVPPILSTALFLAVLLNCGVFIYWFVKDEQNVVAMDIPPKGETVYGVSRELYKKKSETPDDIQSIIEEYIKGLNIRGVHVEIYGTLFLERFEKVGGGCSFLDAHYQVSVDGMMHIVCIKSSGNIYVPQRSVSGSSLEP